MSARIYRVTGTSCNAMPEDGVSYTEVELLESLNCSRLAIAHDCEKKVAIIYDAASEICGKYNFRATVEAKGARIELPHSCVWGDAIICDWKYVRELMGDLPKEDIDDILARL